MGAVRRSVSQIHRGKDTVMHGLEVDSHAFGRLIGIAADNRVVNGVMLVKAFMTDRWEFGQTQLAPNDRASDGIHCVE